MATRTIAGHLQSLLEARSNCLRTGNAEWFERHTEAIHRIELEYLPSGAGIDNGTIVDLDKSTPVRLVLRAPYHHMTQDGYYDGWTDYTVSVRPLFTGISVTVLGRDRNQIKDYLSDVFHECLSREADL